MANKKVMRAGYTELKEEPKKQPTQEAAMSPNPMLAITWTDGLKQNLIKQVDDFDLYLQPKLDGYVRVCVFVFLFF